MINVIKLLKRFNRDRRGVVALIFALSLLPLTMLVGLSIDYSFYAQARAQYRLAGDAAATYAIREATATYALESQANSTTPGSYPNLTTDATTAGDDAGNNWFATQLAPLSRASVLGGEATTNTAGLATTVNATNCNGQSGGFSANVVYVGVYPPFFDSLFSSAKNWYVSGTSTACTTYSYSEVLLLLDTSSSMLIGANASDVQALDDATSCMQTYPVETIALTPNTLGSPPFGTGSGISTYPTAYYSNFYEDDTSARGKVDFTQVANYLAGGVTTNTNGTCTTANTTTYHGNTVRIIYNGPTTDTTTNGSPFPPCAFACHTTTSTATDGYTLDYYGEARRLNPTQTSSANGGVTLRIDAVFNATESVIQDMQTSEQVYGQYTVGVYQFNDNASPIVAGTSGTDPSQEATADLNSALAKVQADDWLKTPTETTVPIVSLNPTYAGLSTDADADYTDFATAMTELRTGKMTTGAVGTSPVNTNVLSVPYGNGATNGLTNGAKTLPAIAAAGTGLSTASPLKDLIIVTDGLDDTNPGVIYAATGALDRYMGPMTSVYNELGTGTAGACLLFKNLGFTIYVLDIDYNPVPNPTFYRPLYGNASTSYVATDYGATSGLVHVDGANGGGDIENWVEGDALNNDFNSTYPAVTQPNNNFSVAPDLAALEACAGTSTSLPQNYGHYFYPANSASDISTAMNSILSSAINGAIRISN